jgi:3-phenylpropionate/trans-cinnamate dioxygenase ferredoxin reductase subunit
VLLSDGSRIPTDLVVIGVGVEPNVEWLAASGLASAGAVPVDATMRTRDPDVFAAGDVALVSDPRAPAAFRFEHWVSAQRQGRHAALAMLGRTEAYTEVPFFWSRQCEVHQIRRFCGRVLGHHRVARRPERRQLPLRLLLGPELVGATALPP